MHPSGDGTRPCDAVWIVVSWADACATPFAEPGRRQVVTASGGVERQVTLEVGLRFALPDLDGVLPGVTAVVLPDARVKAVYVDTHDLRLMRWGVTLWHQVETPAGGAGAAPGWTLKLPDEADGVAVARRELSWPGRPGPVPDEARRMVRAFARTAPLEAVAKLTTQRRRVELRDPSGRRVAEIDDDVVSVLDGRRLAARFRQVEVELAPATAPQVLAAVLARLTEAGAVTGDDRPKVVRALGPRAQRPPDVVVPPLDRDASVDDVVRASIASALTRMVRHDAGIRLDDDPEHVHQARVGTRRLRSDLRTFRRLVDPDWTAGVRVELAWIADALGGVRDADVLTERLRAQMAGLPDVDARPAAALLRRLHAQREDARRVMLQALDSDRYLTLLDDLAGAAVDPPLARPLVDARGPAAPAPTGARRRGGDGPVNLYLVADGAGVAATPPAAGPAGEAPEPDARPAYVAADDGGRVALAAALGGDQTRPAGGPAAADPGPAPGGAAAVVGADAGVLARPQLVAEPLGEAEDGSWPASAGGAARDVLPSLVRGPWRHLRQAVAALGGDPADEALHEVRIRSKRLRYAAEAVVPVIGRPARNLAVAAAQIQGVLGDMQDAVVAESWLRRTCAGGPPAQALVAGELVALQRAEQAACRQAWARPWKSASDKKLRAWLRP